MKVEFKQDEVVLHLPTLPKYDMNALIEAIEKLYATFEQGNKQSQKYAIKIQPTVDIAQILKDYKQPDMSKIVGILPDDEPLHNVYLSVIQVPTNQ
jgi:hypothetical protein